MGLFRYIKHSSVTFALCMAVLSSASASSITAIYTNGKILTADKDFAVHEAMAVEGGRIAAVGSTADIEKLAGDDTKRVDLEKRTVIPGLIDNHAHIMRAAQNWPNEVRFDGITSREEALKLVSDMAEKLGEGAWVIASGGFSPNQFKDDSKPFTIAELDAAAPNNPVLLQHLFGMAYVNTKAFEAIEIDEGTDITWLEIAGDINLNDDDRPTGIVRGAAMRRMLAKINEPEADEYRKRAVELNTYLNEMGLTAVLDATGGTPGSQDFDAYEALAKDDALSLRVFHLLPAPEYAPDQVGEFAAVLKDLPKFEDSDYAAYFQRIGIGERLYSPIHDSMTQPAADTDEHKQAFAKLAEQTAAAGFHLHQHATHVQSLNQHLDTFEQLAKDHDLAKLRWTFTHADGMDEATIGRAQKLGMMIATQSRRLISGSFLEHPLPLIAFGDPPLKAFQDSGIRWGLGTDTMTVAQSNPFWTLWWAITGKAMNGEQLTEATISREEALVAHTRANAWFLFRENDLGSLEKGKLADFVVLDKDYLSVPVDEIRTIRPVMTVVGGKVVYTASQ